MKRRMKGALRIPAGTALVLAAAACGLDRERPSPMGPDSEAALSVELIEPRAGAAVAAGRELVVRVVARAEGRAIAGVGFLARRFVSGTLATIDSVTLPLAGTNEATQDFAFAIPAQLPASSEVEIIGIAWTPGEPAQHSSPRSVRITECQPGVSTC